jgi:hypothetical protein
MAVAHNGIIHGLQKSKNISDTMMFIKHMDKSKNLETQVLKDDGKFCVFTEHQSYLIGDFFYDKGCYYSNEDYKEVHSYATMTESEEELYKICLECKAKTCEGCPFLDSYENESDDKFKNDYRDADVDDMINEMR